MRNFLNFLFSNSKIKSIPKEWLGLWEDDNGKQLKIESIKNGLYSVSIYNNEGIPYKIELLDNKLKDTITLKATFTNDTNRNSILQVEAGEYGIGPTYNLYFMSFKNGQELNFAVNSDDLNMIIIKPTVGIGLYDDFEDDLGVSWAYPLSDFKKKVS